MGACLLKLVGTIVYDRSTIQNSILFIDHFQLLLSRKANCSDVEPDYGHRDVDCFGSSPAYSTNCIHDFCPG